MALMAVDETRDLHVFLRPFPTEVRELCLFLRKWVWTQCPESNELIYDNYNALVLGFGLSEKASDAFCSIAVYSGYINFGFLHGVELADPEKRLRGSGKGYRYLSIRTKKDWPGAYMKKLLLESCVNARAGKKGERNLSTGLTIVKSVSPKKRRPSGKGPGTAK